MKLTTPTRPITAVDYHRLGAEGAFDEGQRVELLEGEIVSMVPIGPGHAGKVNRLNKAFMALAMENKAIVSVQNAIALDGLSEPEPDVALLIPREDFYEEKLPGPQDVLLAIEVADSTLQKDRDQKIPLYGTRGIRESWLVDLNAQTVTAYRAPSAKGYLKQETFKRGDKLAPEAFPDFKVAVDDLLG